MLEQKTVHAPLLPVLSASLKQNEHCRSPLEEEAEEVQEKNLMEVEDIQTVEEEVQENKSVEAEEDQENSSEAEEVPVEVAQAAEEALEAVDLASVASEAPELRVALGVVNEVVICESRLN